MEFIPTKNYGVKLGENPNGKDWKAGVNSKIEYKVVIDDGNWEQFTPTEEPQWGTGGDKMNCVTQSSDNVFETPLNRLIKLGLMPVSHLDWLSKKGYLDANGKPNFNDRISATLNETQPDGNWLWKVADHHRLDGLFPESVLPSDENLSWAEYYNRSLITPEILALGQEFKKYFEIMFEWIDFTPDSLAYHLKQAPIQVVFPNHAVCAVKQMSDITRYFDTYNPFIKDIQTKNLNSAMKLIINIKELTMIEFVHITGTSEYGFLESTDHTKILHRAINENHLRVLAEVFGQSILTPQNTIDFSKAKNIVV